MVLQKIVVPLDGSDNAEQALLWARKYAAHTDTTLVLVRVLSKVYPLQGLPFGASEKEAAGYLERLQKRLMGEGITTSIRLPQNMAADSIVKVAIQEHCSIIVMTTRGGSRVLRRLIGGVTEQVLRISPIPVLVVRSQASAQTGPNPRRILAPQDGSIHAKRALPWAERLARFHGVPIEILHVEPRHREAFREKPSPRDQMSPKLAHWCSLLRRRGIAATFRLSRGNPASEILRNSLPTDLLVITTHGYGGVKHLVLGSVAEKVIRGTETPVFIFKHHANVALERRLVGNGERSSRETGSGRSDD